MWTEIVGSVTLEVMRKNGLRGVGVKSSRHDNNSTKFPCFECVMRVMSQSM